MKILITKMAGGIGGAEIYTENLVKGFSNLKGLKEKIEFCLITNSKPLSRRIEKADGEVFTLPVFHEEVGTKRGLVRLFLALPKYLSHFIPKIVYLRFKKNVKLALFQGTTEKIILTPLLKLLKMKVIWLEHGPMFAFKRSILVLWLYCLNSKLVDKIITVSRDAQEDLINGGIKKEKVETIHTGIDIEYFKPFPTRRRNNLVIGYVGAICREKGLEDFIKTARLMVKMFKSIKFVMVGKSRSRKIKNFVFTGFKKDIRPYLARFSIFFFPTRHLEGLSLAVLEAMAMGIPVVARDIGGNRELVENGKTGCLFKDESPEELANLLIGLLQNEKKRQEMGQRARSLIVKKFNGLIWIEKWQEIFTGYQSQ